MQKKDHQLETPEVVKASPRAGEKSYCRSSIGGEWTLYMSTISVDIIDDSS